MGGSAVLWRSRKGINLEWIMQSCKVGCFATRKASTLDHVQEQVSKVGCIATGRASALYNEEQGGLHSYRKDINPV